MPRVLPPAPVFWPTVGLASATGASSGRHGGILASFWREMRIKSTSANEPGERSLDLHSVAHCAMQDTRLAFPRGLPEHFLPVAAPRHSAARPGNKDLSVRQFLYR